MDILIKVKNPLVTVSLEGHNNIKIIILKYDYKDSLKLSEAYTGQHINRYNNGIYYKTCGISYST